jgi:hypothetical protein
MKLTNTFLGGKMNMDVDERLLPNNQYRYGLNIEVVSPESEGTSYVSGNSGTLRNTLGNSIPKGITGNTWNIVDISSNPLVNARTLGVCKNEKANTLYWIITSDNEDLIVEYMDLPTILPYGTIGAVTYVLRAPKPTVGNRYLNLNRLFPCTGFNCIEGSLYWTDGANAPRMLNIKQFKTWTLANFAWNQDDINVIVKPPVTAPSISLLNDGTDKNYIKDRFLYFSYRFKYTDNRYSSFAPFSMVAFTPSAFAYNTSTAGNSGMLNFYNKVNITVKTGDRQVTDIQLLFKDSSSPNIYVIETINKVKPIVGVTPITDNSTWVYKGFDNSKIYRTLPSSELTRLFDNVPISALAQDFIGSRLTYGNYKQFYDLRTSYNTKIIPNYKVEAVQAITAIPTGQVRASFKTNRDYEIGFSYLDDYGRMSTPITSPTNTCHISSAFSGSRIFLKLTVYHYPPNWATKYRIFIKNNNEKYYNIFPIAPYTPSNEVVTYFLLSSADKNKVVEGDYVTVKTNYSGITNSSTEYKVLEVANKDINAISTGSPAGTYLKIGAYTPNTVAPTTIYSYSSATVYTSYVGGSFVDLGWLKFIPPPSTSAYYSPIVYYPLGGTSSILPTINATFTMTSYPTKDYRYVIEYAGVVGTNHCLNYREFGTSANINASPVPFRTVSGVPTIAPIYRPGFVTLLGSLVFSSAVLFNTGDSWRLNTYSNPLTGKTVYGNAIKKLGLVIPTNFTSQAIPAGSLVSFGAIVTNPYGGGTLPPQTSGQKFTSPDNYTDIQEWFWESGASLNFIQVNASGANEAHHNVFFRYASSISGTGILNSKSVNVTPASTSGGGVVMVIATTIASLPSGGFMQLSGGFSIAFNLKPICLEVTPKDQDVPIFHECSEDLDILSVGNIKVHSGNSSTISPAQSQSLTLPAVVYLDAGSSPVITNNASFNCWAYSNGVESNRIRDDFNAASMEWSPRVLSPVDDYMQQHIYYGITYSGINNYDASVNNINQFNLSLANFKYLDRSMGSIQRIRARNNDLTVYQQNKVSKVLYAKNLLSDADGGGQITSIPEVLGTQIPYQGEFGISNNPESFAEWGDDTYFTDSQRGAVLRLSNNGLFDITNYGMKSFFNTNMKLQPDTMKVGVFDPYYKRYILAETNLQKYISAPTTTVYNAPDFASPAAYTVPVYTTFSIIISP